MTRKEIASVAGIVLVCSSLSVWLGYRSGRPRFRPSGVSQPGSGKCVDFRDAGSHTGETGCVTGRILRAYTSRAGNTFLDFCPDYRNCPFTSVVFASDRNKFGNLETLAGRAVEIRGPITVYQGRAEIIIRDPQQIQVVP